MYSNSYLKINLIEINDKYLNKLFIRIEPSMKSVPSIIYSKNFKFYQLVQLDPDYGLNAR